MRATRRRWLGWGAIAVWVLVLLAVGLASVDDHGRVDRSVAPAADRFVAAWQRSLEASYFAKGTFERRSDVTGASIASEDVVAQDPPRRLHRQLGAVDGRVDDRVIVCPALPDGDTGKCFLGPPGGNTYAEDVAAQVASIHQLVDGAEPAYEVRDDGAGCFVLTQQRTIAVARLGARARYCFDADTGALVDASVDYAGGIHERTTVTELRPVRAVDLEP